MSNASQSSDGNSDLTNRTSRSCVDGSVLGSSTRTSTAFIFRGEVPLDAAVLLRRTLCVRSLIDFEKMYGMGVDRGGMEEEKNCLADFFEMQRCYITIDICYQSAGQD